MELEFRHLKIVLAVADEGSITRAAAALGMSQPSLTSQLQRIERALGAPLFERERTGVVPTGFGRTVLAKARSVVTEMADLRGVVSASSPSIDGPVELHMGSYSSPLPSAVIPRLVEAFTRAVPEGTPPLQVHAHAESSTSALFGRVRSARLDVALVREVIGFELPVPEGVHREVIVPGEPGFVALAERHPLAGREAVDLADLAEENWMVDPQLDHAAAPLRWICREAGFEPRITHEISDAGSARDFVNSGQCVCLAQPTSVEGRGLVVRPLIGDPIRYRVSLAWRPACPVDPLLLRGAVVDAYLNLVTRNTSYTRWWAEHGPNLA